MQVVSTPGDRAQIAPGKALAPEGEDTALGRGAATGRSGLAPIGRVVVHAGPGTAAVIRKGRRSPRRAVCDESATESAGPCIPFAVYARLGCGDRRVLACKGVRPPNLA